MHGLEKEYGDRITFVRANILNPENRELMDEYSFSTSPEFYLVNADGIIIGAWDDTLEEADVRQALDEALAAP